LGLYVSPPYPTTVYAAIGQTAGLTVNEVVRPKTEVALQHTDQDNLTLPQRAVVPGSAPPHLSHWGEILVKGYSNLRVADYSAHYSGVVVLGAEPVQSGKDNYSVQLSVLVGDKYKHEPKEVSTFPVLCKRALDAVNGAVRQMSESVAGFQPPSTREVLEGAAWLAAAAWASMTGQELPVSSKALQNAIAKAAEGTSNHS
jgi:hypothetical protein